MVRDALYIAGKDLKYWFRDWENLFWTFLMPIVFFYFIGTVTGGFSSSGPVADRVAFLAPADAGFLADRLARRLEALGYKVDRVDAAKLQLYTRRITIPAGFTESVLAGRPAKVSFSRVGAGLGADYDQIRVQRAAYAVLADLIVASKGGQDPRPADFEKLDAAPRTLTLSVESAGKRQTIPVGFQQAVPGTMVMFILLVMFTAGGTTLHQERAQGILRRLASSPMSRGAVVLAKWLSRFCVGLIQIAFAMLVGTLLFKVDWGPHLPAVVAILAAYAALAAAGGMLLGNFARTEGQVIGVGVILSNVFAAVGGCWWPIEITPAWAQKLSLAFPTGWTMGALHKLVSFGDSPMAVVPHFVALSLGALAAGYLMARTFRFQ